LVTERHVMGLLIDVFAQVNLPYGYTLKGLQSVGSSVEAGSEIHDCVHILHSLH
jgi:hypothetical protein